MLLSDTWDSYKFGFDYNPQKPFFEQLKRLTGIVPKRNLTISGMPNIDSEYITSASGNKNCYLISNAWFSENCAYSRGILKCRDSFDVYFADSAELCYQGLNIHNSNNIFWSQNIFNSLNLYFCFDCLDCQNCFGCVNLRYKSYYFFNKPLSKELWMQKVSEILGSYKKITEFQKQYEEFKLKFPKKENNNFKSINCTGNYVFESKNLKSCFESSLCEDCKYCFSNKKTKDSYDVLGFGSDSELLLETEWECLLKL